jgi:hypothetical protein
MRILGLFVLGLSLMAVGCTPPASNDMAPKTPPATPPASSGSTNAALPSAVDKTTKLVNMKVSMHCPHGCYPTVKKTLEKEAGVEGVTLAQQKDPDVIDNPVVYITTNTSFDANKAMAALKAEGFTSEVLN